MNPVNYSQPTQQTSSSSQASAHSDDEASTQLVNKMLSTLDLETHSESSSSRNGPIHELSTLAYELIETASRYSSQLNVTACRKLVQTTIKSNTLVKTEQLAILIIRSLSLLFIANDPSLPKKIIQKPETYQTPLASRFLRLWNLHMNAAATTPHVPLATLVAMVADGDINTAWAFAKPTNKPQLLDAIVWSILSQGHTSEALSFVSAIPYEKPFSCAHDDIPRSLLLNGNIFGSVDAIKFLLHNCPLSPELKKGCSDLLDTVCEFFLSRTDFNEAFSVAKTMPCYQTQQQTLHKIAKILILTKDFEGAVLVTNTANSAPLTPFNPVSEQHTLSIVELLLINNKHGDAINIVSKIFHPKEKSIALSEISTHLLAAKQFDLALSTTLAIPDDTIRAHAIQATFYALLISGDRKRAEALVKKTLLSEEKTAALKEESIVIQYLHKTPYTSHFQSQPAQQIFQTTTPSDLSPAKCESSSSSTVVAYKDQQKTGSLGIIFSLLSQGLILPALKTAALIPEELARKEALRLTIIGLLFNGHARVAMNIASTQFVGETRLFLLGELNRIFLAAGRYDEALEVTIAMPEGVDKVQALQIISRFVLLSGKPEMAFEVATLLSPNQRATSIINAIDGFIFSGNFDRAIDLLNAPIEEPTRSIAMQNLCLALFSIGRIKEAVIHAQTLDPLGLRRNITLSHFSHRLLLHNDPCEAMKIAMAFPNTSLLLDISRSFLYRGNAQKAFDIVESAKTSPQESIGKPAQFEGNMESRPIRDINPLSSIILLFLAQGEVLKARHAANTFVSPEKKGALSFIDQFEKARRGEFT